MPSCPLKSKPPWLPNDPNYAFCGTGDSTLANVRVTLVVNRDKDNEKTFPGLFASYQHKRDFPANFTLVGASKVLLEKGDTIEVLVEPGDNGERYRANANACSLTITESRQFG